MKIAVSGSHGFIGTHLVKRLKAKNYEVVPIERDCLYKTGELIIFFEKEQPDYIIHLASYGNHSFQEKANLAFLANCAVLNDLLLVTKRHSYKGFLNFSTTYHNLEAGSFYGSTKAGGEYLVRAYVRNFEKPIVNIRPYSVFGEYEWDFRFIPTISKQIREGETITVSDVSHDWIYVESFIDGLFKVMDNVHELKGKSVGIGTGKRISNLDIAKAVIKIAGKSVEIKKGFKREYEIAAYGKELFNKTIEEKNEIFYKEDSPSLEVGLKRVYNSPDKWLKLPS